MQSDELHKLDLGIAADGDRVSISIGGELDTTTSPRLISVVRDVIGDRTGLIDLDCSDVWFLDSAGVRALIVVRNEATRRGVDFSLVRASGTVARILDMTGLTATLTRTSVN